MPSQYLKFSAAQRRHIRHSYSTWNPSQITRRLLKSKGYDTKKHFVEHMKLAYSVSAKSGTIAASRRRSQRIASRLRRALTFNPKFSTGKNYTRYAIDIGTVIAQKHGDAEIGTLLRATLPSMRQRLKQSWARGGATKAYLTVAGRVLTDGGGLEDRHWSAKGAAQIVTDTSFDNWFQSMITELEGMQEEYGANVLGYRRIYLSVASFAPISGSTYPGKLPPAFHSKKCINVKNKDEFCFLYSVFLGHMRNQDPTYFKQMKNKDRVAPYRESALNTFNRGNLQFPLKVMDIPKFEKLNPELRINVFEYTGSLTTFQSCKVSPLYISDSSQDEEICLLLWDGHYVLLDWKAFSNMQGQSKHYCSRCFSSFRSKDALDKHRHDCSEHAGKKVVMPKEGKDDIKTFAADHMRYQLPGFIVADFEAALVDNETSETTTAGKTRKLNQHESASWQYQVCLSEGVEQGGLQLSRRYVGEGAALNFIETLKEQAPMFEKTLWPEHEMDITEEQEKAFQQHVQVDGHCPLCGDAYKPKKNPAHRHHNHSAAKNNYHGPLCMRCNTDIGKKSKQHVLPIFFHNMKGYDGPLLWRAIRTSGVLENGDNMQVIALNSERFVGFTLQFKNSPITYKFLDSNSFMTGSLETHLENLPNEDKHYLKGHFNESELEFVLKKGFFPYEWFDNIQKLDCTSLPPREYWSSKLTDSEMSEEDYAFVQLIWTKFNCKTFRDYHNLYLTIDTLGLADVMTKFRKTSYEDYGLDPLYSYTLPGYSWLCMLSGVGREGEFKSLHERCVKIGLITDIDQHLLISKAVRGGISMIGSVRYKEFNNPGMGKRYDPSRKSTWARYWDANNLYGGGMTAPNLPSGNFKWMSDEELNVPIHQMKDCFVEVDCDYPEELHDLHNDYPFLPEHMAPTEDMLSPHQKDLLNKLPDGKQIRQAIGKQPKLIPTLNGRKKYVVHIEELQCAVRHGIKVTKVHRGVKFDSAPVMRDYILFNTAKRKVAKNEFEKAYYKLMNNACYGKTLECKRHHSQMKYYSNEEDLQNAFRRQNFKRVVLEWRCPETGRIFVGLEQLSMTVHLNTPVAIGAAILAIAKVWMYEFHMFIKNKYGDKAQLLMTDTDSLFYSIETEDVEADLVPYTKELFDRSNYPKDSPYYSAVNKKVVYKMKNEFAGGEIQKYAGVRAKCYSIEMADPPNPNGEESWERVGGCNKCKGVSYTRAKRTTKDQSDRTKEEQNLTFDDYKTAIWGETHYHAIYRIACQKHQLYTIRQVKKSLSPYDDKRYLVDEVHSLAYGHYKITQN